MSLHTDVLHRFGLRHNPFGDELLPEDAYLTEERSQLLDKLSHLSRYSQFVLVVTGEHGVGKSTFLNQLLPGSDPVMRPVTLRLKHETGPAQMVSSLIQQARIEMEEGSHFEQQIQALHQHAQMLRDLDRMMLILVDDAELLTDGALDVLFTRVMQTPDPAASPHIILFGQPDVLSRLSSPRLQTVLTGRSHHASLSPLTLDETEGYIAHRLDLAGMHGDIPFTVAHYNRIHQQSQGIPAVINRLAQAMLFDQPEPAAGGKRSFAKKVSGNNKGAKAQLPWMHIAAVVILLVTITGAFMLTGGSSDAPEPQPGSSLSITLPGQATQDSSPVQAAPGQPAAVSGPDIVPQQPATLSERLALEEQKLGIKPSDSQSPDSLTGVVPEIPVPDAPAVPVQTPVGRPLVDQPDEPAAPEPVATVSTAPAVPAKAAEPAKPVAKPAPAAKPKATVSASGSSSAYGARLKSWPSSDYTLQMLGTRSESSAAEFIRKNGSGSDFAYFETEYKGAPWFVVVYGHYSSRDAAQQAANGLSDSLKKQKPWPRSVSGVQSSLR
ncbi:AAA family ATPase [Pokkaliibacter sp. CJK22405]|uniref:AAA family ATPase n=1 Tax=Pokkaliibacter sp. CJK22405 TaxID=3384615 RepID=UPI0039853AE0